MRKSKTIEEDWTTIIKPRNKLFSINLMEIIQYRDLVWLFVKRDFSAIYKQTILGPIWYVIQPLMTTLVYVFIFGNLAKLSTDGIPQILFYFSGTMLWSYYTLTLGSVSNTFLVNKGIFSKVYFPRLTVPISRIFTNLIPVVIQIVTLIIIYIYYYMKGAIDLPTIWIILFPLIIIWLALLATGIGMIISSLTTKYRDLKHLVSFGMRLWMYATPVVYPLSQISEELQWIMFINPVSAPIELFRMYAFGVGNVTPSMAGMSIAISLFILFSGLILFHRNENTFVDVA